MSISVPSSDKKYILIENFSLAGNVEDKTLNYPDTASWTELAEGVTPYPCNAAGYVVANAASSAVRDWIVSSIPHEPTFKLRGVVSLGAADNVKLYFRASSNTALLGQTDNSHYVFRIKDNGAALPLVRLQTRVEEVVAVTITSTDSEIETTLGDIACTTKMPFTLELTATQLICKIGGDSRIWPITEFAGNSYFGFACGGTTDKLHELRIW